MKQIYQKENYAKKLKKSQFDFVYLVSEIGSDIDKRNYIVSNEKIEKAGFKATRSLSQGINELVKCFAIIKRTQFANI